MTLHASTTDFQLAKTATLQNSINTSILSILVYEFFAVLQPELDVIWGRKISAVSTLFFLNRYVTLLYGILSFCMIFATTHESCNILTRLNEVITIVMFIVFAIFPAVRIYAIWGRNLSLGLLIFFLLAIPAGMNIYLYSAAAPIVLRSACMLNERRPDITTKVVIASRTVSIFVEALVLLLTCIKTFGVRREAISLHMQAPLSRLLVRKGCLYFLIFLLLNIAQTVIQETTDIEYLAPYIFAVTSVLTTRFLLNLRQVDQGQGELHESKFVTEIAFRRSNLAQVVTSFVANFGEDLEFAASETSDDHNNEET